MKELLHLGECGYFLFVQLEQPTFYTSLLVDTNLLINTKIRVEPTLFSIFVISLQFGLFILQWYGYYIMQMSENGLPCNHISRILGKKGSFKDRVCRPKYTYQICLYVINI